MVGDTPKGASVRFAVPSGNTREEMRDWLCGDPKGAELWQTGDCLLVWANEDDLFTAKKQDERIATLEAQVEALRGIPDRFGQVAQELREAHAGSDPAALLWDLRIWLREQVKQSEDSE